VEGLFISLFALICSDLKQLMPALIRSFSDFSVLHLLYEGFVGRPNSAFTPER